MRTFCDRTNLNHFEDILGMVFLFLYICAKNFGSPVGLPENLAVRLRITI